MTSPESPESPESRVESPDESHESPVASRESQEDEVLDLAVEEDSRHTAHDLGLELPADPDEAKTLLLRELAEARMEAGETLENLQRVAAEFENIERASQRVIESLLPTLDAFDAALAFDPQTESEEKILDGMRSTRDQLLETLARDGFEPIRAVGWPFDPKVHEAVSGGHGGDGELVVTSELRRGYTMRDRVIRPTLVTVDHA